MQPELSPNFLRSLFSVGVVIFLAVIVIFSSFVAVGSGTVGVVRTFGAVRSDALGEGFHFKRPFIDDVAQIDIRLASDSHKATASSQDLQTVTTEVSVQWAPVASFVPALYQKVGTTKDIFAAVLINPAIQESVKASTANFTAEQLVTSREKVKLQIQDLLTAYIKKTLDEKGLNGAIIVANVAITDFNFSDEFNRAIELKVKAEQEALQAKNEKLKLVTQAEAAAEQKKLTASAEAFSIEANSVARAAAIKREAEALKNNPELIQLRAIEKWSGELPRFNGSSAVPFINIGEPAPTH